MLVASVADKAVTKAHSLADGVALLGAHENVRDELLAILDVLEGRISHSTQRLASHPDVPLAVHARYSRLEILAAFGFREGGKMPPWQSGVSWAKGVPADLLAFTLDKTSGGFSPTTRYRDYAISRELVHWESQSAVRADSPTGKRYQAHAQQGSAIMLFARLNTADRAFWFLGPATYVRHEGGAVRRGCRRTFPPVRHTGQTGNRVGHADRRRHGPAGPACCLAGRRRG
jgi:hypothetical protein